MWNVSIIIPMHKTDKGVLNKIDRAVKSQDYRGKIEVIKVDRGLGLADSLNYGIKKAKTEIVVSLHQDCVPYGKGWLKRLIEPLNKGYVASVSKVELPYELWRKFSLTARIMSAKEQKITTPLMDEKGVAYKREILLKIGLFDGKLFRTAGEDFDMWVKLKKLGKIAYPNAKVFHLHTHTFKNRLKKELQLSNGFGALVRIHGSEIPKWWVGLSKAIPIVGWPFFLLSFPYLKLGLASLFWIPLSLLVNVIYCYGFWKGFFNKKQTL